MTPNNPHDSSRPSVGRPAAESAKPEFLRTLSADRLITVDVGLLLEKGEEPFRVIMEVVDRIGSGRVLKLLSPFEPVPLYGVLGRKGLLHWSRPPSEGGEAGWQVFFYFEPEGRSVPPEAGLAGEEIAPEGEDGVVDLDVRGLEAPEPLEKVLEAVEQMAYGSVLRVRHHREPLMLFDLLAERGFAFRSDRPAPDDWEIRIWRKN